MAKSYRQIMIEALDLKGLQPGTIKAYVRHMELLCDFHDGKSPEDLGVQQIKEYQLYLLKDRKLALSTVNRQMSSLRFFYYHILGRTYYKGAFPDVKAPRKNPKVLSESEVKRIIDVLENPLWKAVIMTTYSAGLRQGEVRELKISDIDRERNLLYIRQGKGGKCRLALLSPVLLKALEAYWRKYRLNHPVQCDQLFIPNKHTYNGKKCTRLSHTAVGYFLQKGADLAGVKKKFTHTFCDTHLQPTS